MTISVVIPTWNGRAHLERLLPTIRDQSASPAQVVVVDDGSTDGTAPFLAETYPNVEVIRHQRNRGFVVAANAGLRAATGTHVFLLNNDTVLDPGCLRALVDTARATGAAMIAPVVTQMDRPRAIDSVGIAIDRAGIAWNHLGGQVADAIEVTEPFGPTGGAALYRRDLLAEVGYFDEAFDAYLEDVDLAWRARLVGATCAVAADARLRHAHSATIGANSPRKRFLLGRNKLWTIAKNYPHPEVWRYLPAVVAYDVMALASVLIGSPRAAVSSAARWAALRGRLAGLAGLPAMLAKRREIQARRRISGAALLRLMVAIESPARVRSRFGHLAEVGDRPTTA